MDHAKSLAALKRDPHFAPLIKKHGPPALIQRGQKARLKVFDALLRSIIYQQLSGKAAGTILNRFKQLFADRFPTPEQLLRTPDEQLRAAGLSGAKVLYVKDVAEKFCSGAIKHRSLARMESEVIIEHLLQIKGVGVWTVHMLLIFTLGRPDILPTGDLGVRRGMQRVYKLKNLPTPTEMERLATPWREHASVASWYLWRVADEKNEPSC